MSNINKPEDNFDSPGRHYSLIGKDLNLNPAREKVIIENFFSLEVSDLLEFVNSEGIYQQQKILSLVFISFVIGLSYTLMSYAFFAPEFFCYNETGELFKCDEDIALNNLKFGYEIKLERTSLVDKYQLYGEN